MDEAQAIAHFKNLGYGEDQITGVINEIRDENRSRNRMASSYNDVMQGRSSDLNNSSALTQVAGASSPENLIKWQLELDSILERVEHMLKGDKPTYKNGSIIYISTDNEDERIFNDDGVAEIMRLLSLYINRNTILSNFQPDQINEKVLTLGRALSNLIYLKYDSFGLKTLDKRKLYEVIVVQITDVVHASLLRALYGGERDSLRTARTVSQSEPINQNGMMQMPMQMKERGFFNPMRWIKGKYAT